MDPAGFGEVVADGLAVGFVDVDVGLAFLEGVVDVFFVVVVAVPFVCCCFSLASAQKFLAVARRCFSAAEDMSDWEFGQE